MQQEAYTLWSPKHGRTRRVKARHAQWNLVQIVVYTDRIYKRHIKRQLTDKRYIISTSIMISRYFKCILHIGTPSSHFNSYFPGLRGLASGFQREPINVNGIKNLYFTTYWKYIILTTERWLLFSLP